MKFLFWVPICLVDFLPSAQRMGFQWPQIGTPVNQAGEKHSGRKQRDKQPKRAWTLVGGEGPPGIHLEARIWLSSEGLLFIWLSYWGKLCKSFGLGYLNSHGDDDTLQKRYSNVMRSWLFKCWMFLFPLASASPGVAHISLERHKKILGWKRLFNFNTCKLNLKGIRKIELDHLPC